MNKNAIRVLLALLALALMCSAAMAEPESLEDAVGEASVEIGVEEAPSEVEGESLEAEAASFPLDPFELDVHEITLGVGEKYELYPAVGGAFPIYESSDKKVAKVEKDGTVRAVKAGVCTIYATRDGIVDECDVTVMNAPKGIKLNYKTITLGYDTALQMGDSFDLEFTIPDDSWSNIIEVGGYSKKIIEVDEDNRVTAVGIGSTKLTARTYNGKKASVKITVLAAPNSMVFNHTYLALPVGSSQSLSLVVPKNTGANVDVYSDDPTIAQIDSDGKVTAISEGVTTIHADCFNGLSAECEVSVIPAPTWIEATPELIELGVGETAPITVQSDLGEITGGLSFATSKKSYARVNSSGVVKGFKRGKATIRVKASNDVVDYVRVQVFKAPSSITLNTKTLSLGYGDTARLTATLSKDSRGRVTWKSSDESVVEVDEDGTVYAVGTGRAKVMARTYNKKSAICQVTVLSAPDAIIMDDTLIMDRGETIELPCAVVDAYGNDYDGDVQVKFNPRGIVTLSGSKLTAARTGVTIMTITAGTLSEDCEITVVDDSRPVYGDGPQVIAHRGGIGDTLETENTLKAFRVALKSGADGVELDVHSTKDGVQVINHDTTFTANGKSYTIRKLKFSEIRSKKPSIPTLDEALDVLDAIGANIHLELKENADGKKCVQAIRAHGLEDRTIYFGFYETPLKAVHKADPSATLGLSLDKNTNPTSSSVLKKVDKLSVTILVTNMNQLNESRLETLHDKGYKVSVWTPNTRSACQAFYDMGVDYILTDYPSYIVR